MPAKSAPNATDAFVETLLPPWLCQATPGQIDALRQRFKAYGLSQQRLRQAHRDLLPLDQFMAEGLEQELRIALPLRKARWREVRQQFKASNDGDIDFDIKYWRRPALERLMQNFASNESFYVGTALVSSDDREQVLSDRPEDIAALCRSLDLGRRYQEHLDEVFDDDSQQALAQHARHGLHLAALIGLLKGEVSRDDYDMLLLLFDGLALRHSGSREVRVQMLTVLGAQVLGAVVFVCSGNWEPSSVFPTVGNVQGLLVYIPDDQQPLRHYTGWPAFSQALAQRLQRPGELQGLLQRMPLAERAQAIMLWEKRRNDPQPDPQPRGAPAARDLFAGIGRQYLARLKADAAFVAVPTAQADRALGLARLQALDAATLALVDLAALFVPGVAPLLMGKMIVQTLSHVFEGVADWAAGHHQEAIEHLLGVAGNVAANAALAGGAKLVSTTFERSQWVDGLMPVTLEHGEQRLCSTDLMPYRVEPPSTTAQLLENGLQVDQGRYFWRHEGFYYEVFRKEGRTQWCVRHPEAASRYFPALEFNGERAWRLSSEHPLAWDGKHQLLSRLWPPSAQWDRTVVGQLLAVADVDQAQLRGLLVENRPLPVGLRDTLERHAVHTRITDFFRALGDGESGAPDEALLSWCRARLGPLKPSVSDTRKLLLAQARHWRVRLLEHFSSLYLGSDPLLGSIKHAFPGLPDAYALDVLRGASASERQHIQVEGGLPLALAERARAALRGARLNRMVEGIYQDATHHEDTARLILALLGRYQAWPSGLGIELRLEAFDGRMLARVGRVQGAGSLRVLVSSHGGFTLYDDAGRALPLTLAEPGRLYEALLACLPEADKTRLGLAGAQGGERLRQNLLDLLPSTRLALARLIGLSDTRPWFNLMQRLGDGRVGYALSGRGAGAASLMWRIKDRVRSLYPGFDESLVDRFVRRMEASSVSVFSLLLRQEQAYARLEMALDAWAAEEGPDVFRAGRRRLADTLRRCWRHQGELMAQDDGRPVRLNLVDTPIGRLPELPEHTDFSHVTELSMVNLGLERLPDSFLGCFARLHTLNLASNQLDNLPGVERLTSLQELRLRHNRINLNQEQAERVASLRQLRVLDMSFNPLGSVRLDVGALASLQQVHLRSCELSELPDGLIFCALLEQVDLRSNQIARVPELILDAPLTLRQSLIMEGNPLPQAIRQRLVAAQVSVAAGAEADLQRSRSLWLDGLSAAEQATRSLQWDSLLAEAGATDFFQIISELTQVSDFRRTRSDLRQRLWDVVESATMYGGLREELFDLAASPRTCVDSVASCFSALEVRAWIARSLHEQVDAQAASIRLRMARRLFRLDRVERWARQQIDTRRASGRSIDEVEVSLAYRTGLAQALELPGQPRTLQFQRVADVSQADLDEAADAVRSAEGGDALAVYASSRDFWLEQLQRDHAEAFEQVAQPFWERLDALSARQGQMNDGDYRQAIQQLARQRQEALDALALRLTRDALAAEATR